MELKRVSYKHKNNKILYYLVNYIRQFIPSTFYQKKLAQKIHSKQQLSAILKRVEYYNKLSNTITLKNPVLLSEIKTVPGSKVYFFDLYQYSRYFNQKLKGLFLFGDITEVPKQPTFVKSRPIGDNNANSVLLKWNKLRHFMFIKKEQKTYPEKKNMLVSRGKVHKTQAHRIKFIEKYFAHPMCNIGRVNTNDLNPLWKVPRLSIDQQLDYKFILCLEGNDVASNLKWVMSSQSIAVMPKPKYETWFMEGLLVADVHYIIIKDDYTDLEQRLNYYINNQDKALQIIENANAYVQQFRNQENETLISLLTLKKYFEKTNQTCD
ncbi:MAG: lipopolysaccharide biosynthesis protein [Bacteroidetes bacterium]|nr:lipopolysaccharide biosynthesis protein [Bacteroidota bacterium]